MIRLLALLVALAGTANAQQLIITEPNTDNGALVEIDPNSNGAIIEDVPYDDVRALSAVGVQLKGLDKVSGEVADIALARGETGAMGRIEITLGECRYPEDNPAGEGYAWLTISDPSRDLVLFDGWMVASSPALNALDHPRYDVWVIRCTTA